MEIKIKSFLSEKVLIRDLVQVQVIATPGPQQITANIMRIYSSRHGVEPRTEGQTINFIGAPGSWGHTGLKIGEKALVFLSTISKKLYEDPWNGHILIEVMDGEEFGIYPCKNLWLLDLVPAIIKSSSRQDPNRPNASAIRFSALEEYLMTMIAEQKRIDRN